MWLWELVKAVITVSALIIFVVGCAFLGTALYHELTTNNNEYMFEKIARHVADDYNYVEDVFDCTEFADELYSRLLYAGYDDVKIQFGCRKNETETSQSQIGVCHVWVILQLGNEDIYIEPTSGQVLSKAYYIENYPKINYIKRSTQDSDFWVSTELANLSMVTINSTDVR